MEIQTSIVINASAQRVWEVLMDFNSYPDWNPFIQKISGEQKVGGRLEALIVPPEGSSMTFKPRVLVSEPNREFKWVGKLLFTGLFDGAHQFEIKEIDDHHVEFIQSEKFSGILVPIVGKSIEKSTTDGFEAMNAALKSRAEAASEKS